MTAGLQGLLVIVALVAGAPFLARPFKGRLPTVAILMLGGIGLGPSGLGWLQPDPAIDLFAKIGLGLIFTLIGLNIDQTTVGGAPGRLGAFGWLATLAAGILVVSTLPLGDGVRPVAVVVALSSTALSTLLLMLRESGEWDSRFGRLLLSAGTWGQLGPVLAVALLLGSAKPASALLSVVLVCLVAWLLAVSPGRMREASVWPWLVSVVGSASALPLQLLYLLIVGLIALSVKLGVAVLMGTLLAGLVMRRFIVNPDTSGVLKQLEASAYGLFIPLFFVVAGSRIDLASVVVNPWGPFAFLAGVVLIRGLPQLLIYGRELPDPIERIRFSLLVSQSLNLPIVVSYLEVQAGLMSPEVAAALVGGSLLSVLILPAVALAIKR